MEGIDADEITEDELSLNDGQDSDTMSMLDQVADLANRFRTDMSLTDSGIEGLHELKSDLRNATAQEHDDVGEALDVELADSVSMEEE